MGVVGHYSNDVFISYSHIDNVPFGHPGGGWVDIFHEHLQNFVDVHVGQRTAIWRDKRLTGSELFSPEIEQQLRSAAVLVSVISPGYLQSEWCNRELLRFTETAHQRGDFRIGNLQRVVKVLRLPVERSVLPPLLDEMLGTHFYRVDAASGRARDLLLDARPDAVQMFRASVDDVAQDVCRILRSMAAAGGAAAAPPTAAPARPSATVFLAWTTADLFEAREKLRRELEAHGYHVVPTGVPPLEAAPFRHSVGEALRDARLAIHLIGAHYGFVPEGEDRSAVELQIHAAANPPASTAAARIVWLAPDIQAQDARVSELTQRLQTQSAEAGRLDVLAHQSIEALKTLVLDRLSAATVPPVVRAASAWVYLMCDQLDRATVTPLREFLFDHSLEVRLPLLEGAAEEIRAEHYETLKECDGVLIFWGKAKEGWLRTMLRDMTKAFGLGRTGPYKAASIYLAELPDPHKESFRTREASIIRPDRELDPALLSAFVAQLSRA